MEALSCGGPQIYPTPPPLTTHSLTRKQVVWGSRASSRIETSQEEVALS